MPTKTNPDNEQSNPGQKLPQYFTHPAQHAHLYLIATPLGNLGDISKRAMETIQRCDELWCEDTRTTQTLLNALKLEPKRLRRVDQHTSEKEIQSLLKDASLKRQHIGVMSDAGTPGVSDPGAKVVELAWSFPEIKIEPIPGASAVTALMSISGVQENAFAFMGFFPREEKDALALLKQLEVIEPIRAFVFFESPNRIRESIEILSQWATGEISFVFTKEISKIHETTWAGSGSEFLRELLHHHFDMPEKTRGEWCFVINLSKFSVKIEKPVADWEVTLECLISAGISTKEASSLISQRFSIAKNLAYKKALDCKPFVKKK